MAVAAGEQLREARELKGLTVEDVAARLRVPARYVRALETGDLAGLPEPTFVRGYVKAYARELGLDAEQLVAQLAPVEVKAPLLITGIESAPGRKASSARSPNFRTGASRRRYGMLALTVLAGLVVVVVVAMWPMSTTAPVATTTVGLPTAASAPATAPASAVVPAVSGEAVTMEIALPVPVAPAPVPEAAAPAAAPVALPAPQAAPKTTTRTATPTTSAPAPVPAVVAEPVAEDDDENVLKRGLYIRFRGASWVEVRDANNVVLHTSVQAAGSVLSIDGKPPLSVTFNDASVADVWYNGVRQAARAGSSRVNRIIVGQSPR